MVLNPLNPVSAKDMTGKHRMKYSTGANKSPLDIRTFSFKPTGANYKGGTRYSSKDIEDQHRVGICTSISLTMNARKATGTKYSADFQYLLQKKYFDSGWFEGSSIFHAIKAAHKYGLLPEKYWKHTKESDRKLTYRQYSKKLQAVTDEEIEELLKKTEFPVDAYARVPVSRDKLAEAIDESESGLLARFSIDRNWWTGTIEPLRKPSGKYIITGHAVTESNYAGNSLRLANSWGSDWADKGTAYHLTNYMPTEAWILYYKYTPDHVVDQQIARKQIIGQIMNLLQKIISLLPKLA